MRSWVLVSVNGRLVAFLCLSAVLGVAPGCQKKPAVEKKVASPPVNMHVGNANSRPAVMRPAPAAKLNDRDPALRMLRGELNADKRKALAKIRKQLTDAKASFNVSDRGKAVYVQLLLCVSLLEQIGKKVQARSFGDIPSLAATGYIFTFMAVYQVKDLAIYLVKGAIVAGKKLQFGKAKRFAARSKTLGTLGTAPTWLAARYARIVVALLVSNSEQLRVATFAAVVKVYPKASGDFGKTLAPMLKDYFLKEKSASAKIRMKALLKSIQIVVPATDPG